MKRAGVLCIKDEEMYTNGDGVVPSKVIPDVVILELLNCVAPARAWWATHSEDTKERRKENDAQETGGETDLDAGPSCEYNLPHLFCRLFVQKRHVSEALWFATQQCLHLRCGVFLTLLN